MAPSMTQGQTESGLVRSDVESWLKTYLTAEEYAVTAVFSGVAGLKKPKKAKLHDGIRNAVEVSGCDNIKGRGSL